MAATTTLLTIEDFERLPDDMAEGHELVDGELVDVSGNIPLHNLLGDYLIAILLFFVTERGLGMVIGEQEYEFSRATLTMPGRQAFSARPRRSRCWSIGRSACSASFPNLAVEIASPVGYLR